MNHQLHSKIWVLLFCLFVSTMTMAQGTPDVLYYRFNGSGTFVPNLATAPPAGAETAVINGSLSQGSTGACGGAALVGTSTSSTNDYVNTNWATNLHGSWTISFWTSDVPSTTSTHYIFGDFDASQFRCFTGGVAGAGNWILRGPIVDLPIPGGAAVGPTITTIVMDSAAGQMYAYVNGTLVNTVNQAAVNITGPLFKVGGYSSNTNLPASSLMDEFRLYSRALTPQEVANLAYTGATGTTLNISLCDNQYTSPTGKYIWTTSGTYTDTLVNSVYCDSIITVNLELKSPTTATIFPVVCNTYTSPSGNYTWTTSGTYSDTIPNAAGCDSIIAINLTVNYTTTNTIAPVVCNSYTSPSGKYNWTLSGAYTDTIPNNAGCDSVITINLTVNFPTSSSISPVACFNYTSPSGKYNWTASGSYNDTIPNTAGCDSVITISLTIDTVNTNVTLSGQTLTASAPGATYKWLDCNNGYAVIPQETAQSFAVTVNGNYAVEITQNSCVDTSVCFSITNVGIKEAALQSRLAVYPNPSNGMVTIMLDAPINQAVLKITSVTGQVVLEQPWQGEKMLTDISGYAQGIYFVEILQPTQTNRAVLIKN